MDNETAVVEKSATVPQGQPTEVVKSAIIPEGWNLPRNIDVTQDLDKGELQRIIKQTKDPNRQRGLVFENEKQRNAMAIRKGLTKPGRIDYGTLRRIAMSVYVARICINSLKSKTTKTQWVIQPTDQKKRKNADRTDKRIKEVADFFKHPNQNNETFRTLLDKMCEDLLVLDSVSLEKTRFPNGDIAELHFVDSATIRPVYDEYGNQDIEIALPVKDQDGENILPVSYLQILNNSQYGGPESGEIVAAWPKKDFIHFHMHPQGSMEGFGYGLSPLEGVMSVVSNLLNSDNFNSTYFEEGAFPPVILNIVGQMNQRDLETFKEYFYQELSGQFHRPAIMASTQKSEVINLKDFTNRDMQFMEYTLWLAKMMCAAYEIAPDDIGVTDTTGSKSVSEVQKDISNLKGYSSILDLFKQVFNQEIIWKDFGYDDLEFDWVALDNLDPDIESQNIDRALKNGTITINEARLSQGDTPYDSWADEPMVLTAEGYKPMLAPKEAEEGDEEGADQEDSDEVGGEKPYKEQDTKDIKGEEVKKARKSLYISRPVKNAKAIIEWAKAQGFTTTLPPEEMHVTIAYSSKSVEWDDVVEKMNHVKIERGRRSLAELGDKGAVVLRFSSKTLKTRWNEILKGGASWDFDDYQPHITISYAAGDVDLSGMLPYDGPIELGPEERNEIDEDWEQHVSEKMNKAIFTNNGFRVWADDRGVSQPFICMEIKTGQGYVIKPPVAVNLQSQNLEIGLTHQLAEMGLNVKPVTKMTYMQVMDMFQTNPEVMMAFEQYCQMTPDYDSERWRVKYGGSRKFPYYLVSEYIDGYSLTNPLLVADMKRDPGSYAEATRDLAKLWKVEEELVLGDRRAEQYIIGHNKRGYGVDYQFMGDKERWNKTRGELPTALSAIPELKNIFDGELTNKSLVKAVWRAIKSKISRVRV